MANTNKLHTVTIPTLALRGLTIFPNMSIHFDVGRESSIRALNEAMENGTPIFLVTQRQLAQEAPEQEDLYTMGTISNVRQILRLPGDMVRVMVEGKDRETVEALAAKAAEIIRVEAAKL